MEYAQSSGLGRLFAHLERFANLYAGLGLVAGISIGLTVTLAPLLAAGLAFIVAGYNTVAPIVIFLILAPTLLKIVQSERAAGATPLWVIWWFVKLRLGACVFAVVMTSLVFSLPVVAATDASNLAPALRRVGGHLLTTMRDSPYFHAIYVSFCAPLLLARFDNRLTRGFAQIPDVVERIGGLFTHIVPLFTFLVGVYVTTLPVVLHEHFAGATNFGVVRVAGIALDGGTREGLLSIYFVLAIVTGVFASIWHLGLLAAVRLRTGAFDLGHYWKTYFMRVYPLLWATASEALATPLNLHLMGTAYPRVAGRIRLLSVAVGSVFNINGTMICCFVMAAAVSQLLRLPLSALQLALCLPIIFVVGFGVPGIPGELVLFAGPLAAILRVPDDQQARFLLAFIGLQIGLPDSFRSGANSTDNCPSALLLDHIHRNRIARHSSRMAS